MEYQAIRALMDAEDVRIAQAFEMKELMGYKAEEIAEELGVSAPRVYQLIARAKAIGKQYRKENSDD
jgi:DNA-directed RNA polymerase specialized sigma24 family protein